MALPEDQQGTKSPRKRKSTRIEVSPPKRQPMTEMGPIEAMWLHAVTKDERYTSKVNLDFPTTPSPPQLHLDFLPQDLAPYKSNAADFEISPEDLQSMHDFINNKTDLICGTSNQVSTSTTISNINMAPHSVNMKAKRAPLKNARRPSSRHSEHTTKVTKKPKAIPKKTQHKRTDSIAPSTITSPVHPARHRSIDELLSLNFYSLNEQEKCRVMLPMLRSLDPRQLEASLGELPCIQAKGAGHEVHVARAIHDSPPTPEADAELAIKLTTGFPSSPTPATKASHSQLFVPQASLSPRNTRASIEVSEDHGAIRQREALDKAALLQAQGRKR